MYVCVHALAASPCVHACKEVYTHVHAQVLLNPLLEDTVDAYTFGIRETDRRRFVLGMCVCFRCVFACAQVCLRVCVCVCVCVRV